MLDFIPYYADRLPVISYFWRRENAKRLARYGSAIDLSDAYWSPPLDAARVIESEALQINNAGFDAIVSITDHDSISGTLSLIGETAAERTPISLEWTVPFLEGFFHLGVHNLPPDRSEAMTAELLAFTFNESEDPENRLNQLFEMLEAEPAVLIVFNHPLWDIEMVGERRHNELLQNFLGLYHERIHAFELNGFRSWSENKATIELANAYSKPLISGGDRHGCCPNTMLNLTNARSFSEFADEIRTDKHSEVLIMPEYSIPLYSRQLQSFSEILSDHSFLPEHRRRWFDRVFIDLDDGRGSISLSEHGWKNGGPAWLRAANKTLGFLGGPAFRPLFRALRKRSDVLDLENIFADTSDRAPFDRHAYLEAR